MSLIFAVFLTNPAPICVLDEVDAPLDDANVERFCNLLDDMRKRTETRFVVITHNPITMSRVDRLFGVTMAERGVSASWCRSTSPPRGRSPKRPERSSGPRSGGAETMPARRVVLHTHACSLPRLRQSGPCAGSDGGFRGHNKSGIC